MVFFFVPLLVSSFDLEICEWIRSESSLCGIVVCNVFVITLKKLIIPLVQLNISIHYSRSIDPQSDAKLPSDDSLRHDNVLSILCCAAAFYALRRMTMAVMLSHPTPRASLGSLARQASSIAEAIWVGFMP